MTQAWFKVIQDGRLLGVATDQSFARCSAKNGRLHICDAIDGQYLVLNDRFYRDDWMLPLAPGASVEYETAAVVAIPEKEYDILKGMDDSEPANLEELINAEPEESRPKQMTENEAATVDFIRARKLKELSDACRKSIESGFSLVLSDGAPHHFSMSQNDQLNLEDLQRALEEGEDLIYHADGELMQYYSPEDASDILKCARKWRTYNLALYNTLKNWINHLEDISVIDSVTLESEIPDEYCTPVFETLTENF